MLQWILVQFPHKQAKESKLTTLTDIGFAAHTGNNLLSILTDSDEILRSQAVDTILSLREIELRKITPTITKNESLTSLWPVKFCK